jgi:hypothetical protein
MIYAIRMHGHRETLIECATKREFEATVAHGKKAGLAFRHIDPPTARLWVKGGKEHETGLFIDDDGRVRYAEPQS